MKNRLLISIMLFFISATPCCAHKVNLFCYREGSTVYGEAYYSGGKAAQESKVEAYDSTNNELLASTFTDKQGKFSFTVEKIVPLKVILHAGQGHKAEFILAPEETDRIKDMGASVPPKTCNGDIAAIVDKKIKPLKEQLIRLEKEMSEPSFTDVFGGLGWIAAVFSLLYLWRKRNAS